MNLWTLLHRYNRMVDNNLALSLVCPDCEQEFAFVIGPDDEPVAWCAWEDKKFYPGTLFWDKVRSTVQAEED